MGAIVAVISRNKGDVVPKVVTMLTMLKHRGDTAHGVATPTSVRTAKSIEKIPIADLCSNIALGNIFSQTLLRDRPQPIQARVITPRHARTSPSKNFTFVFEGRFFPFKGVSEIEQVLNRLRLGLNRGAQLIIETLEGAYAFAIASQQTIIIGRDTFGIIPLYYDSNEQLCVVASERKALWALKMNTPRSFPPGCVAEVDSNGFRFRSIRTPFHRGAKTSHRNTVTIDVAAKHLRQLLQTSVRNKVCDLESVAVAFSGGLDSSIVAFLAKKCGVSVHLVTVGLAGQSETKFAEKAATALNLPIHVKTYSLRALKEVIPRILWLIEEPDVVKTSIAIPLFWAAQNASELGKNVLLAGQGADELFGGYHKYLEIYSQQGVKSAETAIINDMTTFYKKNFQRDNPVCAFSKVELRLPYVTSKVVDFALGLPFSLKIASTADPLRKRVLRTVANDLRLPLFIVNKRKKAIQYSTGVNTAIRQLAKKDGVTPKSYLLKKFTQVFPEFQVLEAAK